MHARYALACVFTGVALAACGGGSTTSISLPPSVSSYPTIAPQQPFSGSVTVPLAAGSSAAFPAGGGYAPGLALGASSTVPAGASATLSANSTSPNAAIPLALKHESAAAGFAMVYLTVTPSATVTIASGSTLSTTIPGGIAPSGSSFYLALYDPLRPSLGWQDGFAVGTLNGSTLTFTLPAYTLSANVAYQFAILAWPAPATQPTAAPSISPLPAPTPTPAPNPLIPGSTSVNINGLGNTAALSASEAGYSGAISATSSNTGVATVTASSSGPSASFTLTSVAAGSTTITLHDSYGQTATVTVNVTTSTVVVQ